MFEYSTKIRGQWVVKDDNITLISPLLMIKIYPWTKLKQRMLNSFKCKRLTIVDSFKNKQIDHNNLAFSNPCDPSYYNTYLISLMILNIITFGLNCIQKITTLKKAEEEQYKSVTLEFQVIFLLRNLVK